MISPGSTKTSATPFPTGAALPHDAVIFSMDASNSDSTAGHPARDAPRPWTGLVDLVGRLRAGGVRVALVTTGSGAAPLPASADLAARFDVVLDGRPEAASDGPGDRQGAVLRDAAHRLGVAVSRTAVVTDRVTKSAAAHRGGFGLVVGIGAEQQRRDLHDAGADLVVADVQQLDLGALRTDPWLLVYEGFDPAHESHREALTTLGNGYLGTRGAAPEHAADGVHYPGTYLAGVYNRLTSTVHGRQVEDEHLVNAPNWLVFDLVTPDSAGWFAGAPTDRRERRELDLRRGVLTRQVTLADRAGRRLRVTQRRLVSMARPHLAALETTLIAEGWDGTVTAVCGIDADVRNRNVAEYRPLTDRHLRVVATDHVSSDTVLVEVDTSQSGVRIATAARTTVSGTVPASVRNDEGRPAHLIDLILHDGEPVSVTKTVAVFTSHDPAIASPRLAALQELTCAPAGLADLLPAHERAWASLWQRFGIDLDTDRQTRLVLNLHVFHLLQSVSPHTAGVDAGVPTRGLHGEGYRGHVFWDELFVLPVITAHLPWVARSLLDYRHRRLDAARRAATDADLAGAMFPWQSGSDGREETPRQLYNVRSGRWMPDNSRRQRHVGLAVAYNAWQYYQATGDVAWLARRGADLIIEVARLFTSLATHDPATDRYHIAGVMGPDEYHDGYPDTPGQGLRDNAYTNVLAAWICRRAVDTLAVTAGHNCDELQERLTITPDEPHRWEHLSRRLTVPFHDDVISQFAGYENLAEFAWDRYRATYGNIGRLDLILEAEGDSTNRYKLAKQADTLMLIYLLGPDELLRTLDRLDYPATRALLTRTVDYYLARTAHGSTLSRVVHASVLAHMDPHRAWHTFRQALDADLDDTQGGTTGEGIHLAAMAGTIDIITRAFAGSRLEDTTVSLDPRLPPELRRVTFNLVHRGQRLRVTIQADGVQVAADTCASNPDAQIRIGEAGATVPGGQTCTLPIARCRHPAPEPGDTSTPAR